MKDVIEEIKNSFLNRLGCYRVCSFLLELPDDYLIGEARFLGINYIPLLAEVLGFSNPKKVIQLGVASLFGRAFVIAQDLVIDHYDEYARKFVLILPILYQETSRGFVSLVNGQLFEAEMDGVLIESAAANLKAQRHRKNIIPYRLEELEQIGIKTGLAVIPAKALCYVADRPELKEDLSLVAYNILSAIQIADDICDIEEDFQLGEYTIPITHGQILSGAARLSLPSIYQGLFGSGLFEYLMEYSIGLLRVAQDKVSQISHQKTITEHFIAGLIQRLAEIEMNICRTNTGNISPRSVPDFTQLQPVKGLDSCDDGAVAKYVQILKELEPNFLQQGLLTQK